jgi:endonuclease/exonuclease/phosphatase family metal-dependent hydrolase
MSFSQLLRNRVALFAAVPAFVAALVSLACSGLATSPPPAETGVGNSPATTKRAKDAAGDYFFCFWNVENLFDDRDDGLKGADGVYDKWFAEDEDDREKKYNNLADALVKMNDGKGPDIIAAVEVESQRAAELLRDHLNSRLEDPALHYKYVLFKEVRLGRHIAPAIISRLPASDAKQLDRRYRILEGRITVGHHELVILASHWTSRVSDEEGDRRDVYGDKLYGHFRAMYESNPKVDVLVCGDFNDPPDDDSVEKHLHAIGDRKKVLKEEDPPLMLNLFRNLDPAMHGTHYDSGHWFIFDQITVSRGMLDDEGWSCEPDSAKIVNSLTKPKEKDKVGRPWRFGNRKNEGDRGCSDHFPVTVRLQVHSAR